MLRSTILKLTPLMAIVAAPVLQAAPVQWTADVGGNGHSYELVCCENWSTSLANASTASFAGLQGYLATVTNAAEDAFIADLALTAGVDIWWLGGSDEAHEEAWTWPLRP